VFFGLLGPFEFSRYGRAIKLGAGKLRALLAVLVLRPGVPITVDELVDVIWGEHCPGEARATLHSYVMRVRRVIGSHPEGPAVTTVCDGYRIELGGAEVDVHCFTELIRLARGADPADLVGRVETLRQALGLWRGPALAGVPSEALRLGIAQHLDEQRLAVWEELLQGELAIGRHREVLPELREATSRHPLRETFWADLILAQYRCGQRADALYSYRHVSELLRTDLGMDPGAELRRLHQAVLTDDPTLQAPVPRPGSSVATTANSRSAGEPTGGGAGGTPAQLPGDVDVFTGRADELAELDRVLVGKRVETAAGATSVVISAVSGTAGVGKTALALRWAHRVRGEFPDGQLYVNLRGYDPDQPVSAAAALAGFLRPLGVPGQDIPLEVDERAALYRSLLDGRRILVVLDNAATVEQVRPLLPGVPSCVALVTSRDSLAGLVARHGARRLDLDLLPLEDAVALLGALIGGRVTAEPKAAAVLAGQCARLPLALRVAAELAVARSTTSLAALVAELADDQRRLELLDAGGDRRTDVRGVFSWSYQQLPADAARAFRLIGLHPGPDLDSYAVAALTDSILDRAHHVLGLLTRAHLVQPTSSGRYGMHDLLRAYATHLATSEDSEVERRAASTRLFDHYLATAGAAMDTLHPAEQHRRPRIPTPDTPSPPVADPPVARAWLDTERAVLTATCAHTAAHGWPGHTAGLATTLFRYLEVGGHYPEAVAIHTHALHAARHAGDPAAEAYALSSLGVVCWQQGRYQQAADYFERSGALCRAVGDRAGEARALGHLGNVYWHQGRYQQAADYFERSGALWRAVGDRAGEARVLTNLGLVHYQQGNYQQAADYYQQALAQFRELNERVGEAYVLDYLGGAYQRQGHYQQAVDHHQQALAQVRELGDRRGEANVLDNLGVVYQRQGHYQQAVDHHQQALAQFRELGYHAGEAEALTHLGVVYHRQGHYQQAADHHQQALALSRKINERASEADALNGLGETLCTTGQLPEAHLQHTAALTLATQIGDRYQQARAHNGLAHTHHTTGELDQAYHHWRHALTLYTDLGVPDGNELHTHLAALDQGVGDDHHMK